MHIQRKTFPSISPLAQGAQKIHYIHNFQSNIFMTKLNEKYCEVEASVQQLTDLTKVQYTSQTFFNSYKSQDISSLHALEKISLLIISSSPSRLKLLFLHYRTFLSSTPSIGIIKKDILTKRQYSFLSEDRKPTANL